MNRIATAIGDVRETLATLDPEKVASVNETLALDFDEHFAYQQAQARAHVEGKLSTDEAQVIYVALGEVGSPGNGGWAAGTDTATKYVVTQVVGELLKARLGR